MEDASIVEVNLDFTNKRTKFKITATLQKETPQQEVMNRNKEILLLGFFLSFVI